MMYSRLRKITGYAISLFLIITGRVSKKIHSALKGEIILSIYFHQPDKKTFSYIINYIEKKGLHFISAETLIEIIEKNRSFPKGAVFVSIDDGWKSNMTNIFDTEIGKKIPIALFATAQPIIDNTGFWWSYVDVCIQKGIKVKKKEILKNLSNEERIKEIDALKRLVQIKDDTINLNELKQLGDRENITIGSHTYSHPILTKCNEENLLFEISESKNILEKELKINVKYFAYPNGKHTARERNIIKKNGYKAAFGTNPEYIMRNKTIKLYDIPRFEISENVTLLENICRLSGVWYTTNLSKRDNA